MVAARTIEPASNAVAISATASWREVATSMSDPSGFCTLLSPAERVVLEYLRRGLTNREIAHALGKAEATVKNQVAACLHKCGVPTRGRLIAREAMFRPQ